METVVSWVLPALTPSGNGLSKVSFTLSPSSLSVSSVAVKVKLFIGVRGVEGEAGQARNLVVGVRWPLPGSIGTSGNDPPFTQARSRSFRVTVTILVSPSVTRYSSEPSKFTAREFWARRHWQWRPWPHGWFQLLTPAGNVLPNPSLTLSPIVVVQVVLGRPSTVKLCSRSPWR